MTHFCGHTLHETPPKAAYSILAKKCVHTLRETSPKAAYAFLAYAKTALGGCANSLARVASAASRTPSGPPHYWDLPISDLILI